MNSSTDDLGDVVESLNSMFQNYGVVAIYVSAFLGVFLAGWAAVRLHSILQDDNSFAAQSRGTVGGCVLGIVIGSLITISSVIVTWFGTFYG